MPTPAKEPRVRIQLDLDYAKRQRIVQWAQAQETTITQVLNQAVDEYIERHHVPEAD